MNNTEASDLPCGCRTIKSTRLCPYHKGYIDGYETCKKDQELVEEEDE